MKRYFLLIGLLVIIFFLKEVSATVPAINLSVQFSINNWSTGNSSIKSNKWFCEDGQIYKTYGSSIDTWGFEDNLKGIDFTNSTFQVGLISTAIDITVARADHIQVRIYYESPPNVTLTSPTPANNSIIGSTLRVNATTQIDILSCYLQNNINGTWVNTSMSLEVGQRSCYINLAGLNNNTFSYNVIASNGVLPAGTLGISQTRNVSIRNVPSLLNLNSIANNTITSNRSVILNWTINNTQNDEVIVRGFISQNTTGNISKQMFYYQEGALNNSYTYNFSNMLTPVNSDSLWALYRFDNNSDVNENSTRILDYSKYSRNGSSTGANFRNSKFGRGFYHSSPNELQEITMQSKDFANVSVNGMSINVWINMTQNTSSAYYIVNRKATSCNPLGSDFCFFNLYYSVGKMYFDIYQNGNATVCSSNFSGMPTNINSMITATFNGSSTSIYKDGILKGNTTCVFNGITQSAWQSTQNVIVGETLSDINNFEGTIDELGFWNKSLTAQEVSDLYNLQNDTYFWYMESNEYNLTNRVNSSLWQFRIGAEAVTSTNYVINITNSIISSIQQSKTSDSKRNTILSTLLNFNINRIKTTSREIINSLTISNIVNKLSNFFRSVLNISNLFFTSIRKLNGFINTQNNLELNSDVKRIGNFKRSNILSLTIDEQTTAIFGRIRTTIQQFILTLIPSKIYGGDRNINQQFTLTSSINKIYNSIRGNVLSLTITNSVSKVYSSFRSITQNIIFNLSLEKIQGRFRIITQQFLLFFNINLQKGQSSRVSQSITITSLIEKIQGRFTNIVNSLILNFNTTKLSNLFRNINEQIVLTFSTLRKATLNISISIQSILSNSINRVYSGFRSLTQNIIFNLSLEKIQGRFRNGLQQFILFFNIDRLYNSNRNINQQFVLTSQISKIYNSLRNNNLIITINSSVNKLYNSFRSLTQQIILNLSLNRIYGQSKNIINQFLLFFNINRRFDSNRNINQQYIFNNSLNKIYNSIRNNNLIININSLVSKTSSIFRSISQQIIINLSPNRIYTQFKNIINQLLLFLNINSQKGQSRSLSQEVTITSLVNKIQSRFVSITNNLIISLDNSKLSNFFRSINQQIILNLSSIRKASFNILTSLQIIINNIVDTIYTAVGVQNIRDIVNSFSLTNILDKTYSSFRNIINNINLTNTINRISNIFRSITNSINQINIVNRMSNLFRSADNQIIYTNLVSRTYNSIRNNQLSLILSTSINKFYSSIRDMSQEFLINLSIVRKASFNILTSVQININNIVNRLSSNIIKISQSLSMNNLINKIASLKISIQQMFNINSVTSKISNFIRQNNFSLIISSSVNRVSENIIRISNSLTISNLANKLSNFNRNIQNILNINSLVSKTSNFFKSIYQSINLNSIASRTAGFVRNVVSSLTYFINLITSFLAGTLTTTAGGGGGGTGINPKVINLTLCNYTYDYVNDYGTDYSLIDLQIEKIKTETNLTFEWTETRDYIDNWQSYCSDNINRSLKENLVCSKAKESKEFRNDSRIILNITESLKDKIVISTNLFNYYIDNYDSLCEEIKPFSITTTKGKVSLLVLLIFLVFILLIVVLQYKERILILLAIKKKRDKNVIKN